MQRATASAPACCSPAVCIVVSHNKNAISQYQEPDVQPTPGQQHARRLTPVCNPGSGSRHLLNEPQSP